MDNFSHDVLYLMLPYIEMRDLPHFLCVCKYWKTVLDKHELDLWQQFQIHRCKFQIAQLKQENTILEKQIAFIFNAQQKLQIRRNKDKCNALQVSINKAKSSNLQQLKERIMQDVYKTMEHVVIGKAMALLTSNACYAPVAFVNKWNTFLQLLPSEKSIFYAKIIKEVVRACNVSQCVTTDAANTSKSIQNDNLEPCSEFIPLVLKLVNLFGIMRAHVMHTMVKTAYDKVVLALMPLYKSHSQIAKFTTPLSLTAVATKNLGMLKLLVEQHIDSMATFGNTPADFTISTDAKVDCGQVLMLSKTNFETIQCNALEIAYSISDVAMVTYLQDELLMQLLPESLSALMMVARRFGRRHILNLLEQLPVHLFFNPKEVTNIFTSHLYYEAECIEAMQLLLARGVNPFLDPDCFTQLVSRCHVSSIILH